MKKHVPFDDAVDLLDADHKAVKKMFLDHATLCEQSGTEEDKYALAQSICQALIVHSQLEEEIFYPLVRDVIGKDELMDDALKDHAQAKEVIEQIQAMNIADPQLDSAVKVLKGLIDQHVLQEREVIFLKARYAALDLKEIAVLLLERKQELMLSAKAHASKEAV